MGIKKYTNNAWVDVGYKKYSTETEIISALPKQIIGDGQPVSAYTIKGKMQQSGTPTPSYPIYPTECGDLETTGEYAGQYKLPISLGGTTANVYLGQTQSTRQIKKLELTGEENWVHVAGVTGQSSYYRFQIGSLNSIITSNLEMCSHYSYNVLNSTTTGVGFCTQNSIASNADFIAIRPYADNPPDGIGSFKRFLANLYGVGKPVTVWCILATPETAALNEPIRRIGSYADSITAANIPTTGTAESFDVTTALKPSEVSLTYHGWHEHNDVKFTT